ncbi:MAG: bifunctional phosphopantothenoylcysteine decarboxylase/phosphopantothenate--cysteine ligase CoaBC [Nitrospirota bacterium]
MILADKKILLGVTGSIAAYKAILILRQLTSAGADVTVIMTASAKRFVTPLTFKVLSKKEVYSDLFGQEDGLPHLSLLEGCGLILIAPATANFINKMASGIADDLLSSLLLSARVPVIVAPAMDGDMWKNPIVQKSISILRETGVTIIEPESGLLASGKEGEGRLAREDRIFEEVCHQFNIIKRDLSGEVIIVTAGPTREPVDPVRFLSNRSSGKMGYAIAIAARDRGARVILISGITNLPKPEKVEFISAPTTHEMREAVLRHLPEASMLIMAAAVADYRPKRPNIKKLKKSGSSLSIEMEETEDILEEIGKKNTKKILVGFAAETDAVINNAVLKLRKKNLDLIVANDITLEGGGFESDTNIATIIDRDERVQELPLMYKKDLAQIILERVMALKERDVTNT